MSKFGTFIKLFFMFLLLISLVVLQKPKTAFAATITVTGTGDTIAVDGFCTLREAITAANTNAASGDCPAGAVGLDTITFAIGGVGTLQTIAPATQLPNINEALLIDGTTQSGTPGCANITTPLIEINGGGAAPGSSGFAALVANIMIRGLAINSFPADGIVGVAADNLTIECNFIGTNPAGTAALPNGGHGMWLGVGSDSVRIGTDGNGVADAAERNLISASGLNGIEIRDGSNAVIAGNIIGTDITGAFDLGNGFDGVLLYNESLAPMSNNRIGTNGDGISDAVEGNLISGNANDAIEIRGSTNGVIAGNFIGTNAAGTGALGNTRNGVFLINSANDNFIGTNGDGVSDALERNLISASGINGVEIQSSSNVVVAGNVIGTDITGTLDLGNALEGVLIFNNGQPTTNNRIGTNGDGVSDTLERNLISGNTQEGIEFRNTAGNVVAGNFIGTNAAGTGMIPNSGHGIFLLNSSNNNVFGVNGDGSAGEAAEGNLISGSGLNGIELRDSSSNVVAGNLIGTDITGAFDLGNGVDGVLLFNQSLAPMNNNRIGTNGDGVSDLAERNLISGNNNDAIEIRGNTNTIVAGNFIGTNAAGTTMVSNNGHGVFLNSISDNTRIGTDGNGTADASERNLISANALNGVEVRDSSNAVIAGNLIGTDIGGTLDFGNINDGVLIASLGQPTLNNRVGTNGDGISDAEERNVISGNNNDGIEIRASTGNIIAGNFIGTTAAGTGVLGNAAHGIIMINASDGTRVGTDGNGTGDLLEGNIISANGFNGIEVRDSSNAVVAGNLIGTDIGGTLDFGNGVDGVLITPLLGGAAINNRVGTNGDGVSDLAERNLISGNNDDGVEIRNTNNNTVAGNYIGTNAAGTAAVSNNASGVRITNGRSNTIGTNGDGVGDAVEGNLISGNGARGVYVTSLSANNVIAGNIVGLAADGVAVLGNAAPGVLIENSSENLVGTNGDGISDVLERNVVSANQYGVVLQTSADSNTVAGNYVGTDITGTLDRGNANVGVYMQAVATNNVIGTNGDGANDVAERNIISGNNLNGVLIADPGSTGNQVAGNYIGTDLTGSVLITNLNTSVYIFNSPGNFIGTNGDGSPGDANEGNVIASTAINNVYMEQAGSTGNRVAGNFIGTNAAGNALLGAASAMNVLIHRDADNNIIGTNGDGISDALERNVIAGAGLHGIRFADINATGNVAAGNFVGTDVTGTIALGNSASGIAIDFSAGSSRIGTNGDGISDDLERNVISGNQFGISLGGPAGFNGNTNIVAGNFIGTNAAGNAALPNTQGGIIIRNGASFNTIGGDILAERNLISGNNGDGILITDTGSIDNRIENNVIGTDLTNTLDLGNAAAGIAATSAVDDDAFGATISLNIIRFNAVGVNFIDAAQDSLVNDNCIYTNTAGVSNTSGIAPVDPLNATSNWWGDISGPGPVGSGIGDTVTADVTFSPFLNTPPTLCPMVIVLSPTPSPTPTITPTFVPGGTSVAAAPGIFIEKAVDKTLAQIGDALTYTITFTNPKGNTLNNVVIADTFDSRLSNIRVVSTTLGSAVVVGNSVTVQGFSLAPGQRGTLIVTALISTRATAGDVISNSATLESPDASIHVSNVVTTTILPGALPATGESPLWRLPLLALLILIMALVVMGLRRSNPLVQ